MYKLNGLKKIAFGAAIITSFFNSNFASAETIKNFESIHKNSDYLISLDFAPAPEKKLPESTAGAARRGSAQDTCVLRRPGRSQTETVSFLMPDEDNYVQTVSSEPTLFFHIPRNKADFSRFILTNEKGEYIDIQESSINRKSGLLKVTLSPEKELEIDETYKFQLSLLCDSSKSQFHGSNHIEGTIKRVELNSQVKSKLQMTPDTLTQAKIYAKEWIWLDTLDSIASVKNDNPKEWTELLESVGLQEFVDEPLIN